MHSLHYAVGLRVVGGRHHVLDAKGATEGRPRRSELGWEPRFEVTVAGTPKLEIHSTRALMRAVVAVS